MTVSEMQDVVEGHRNRARWQAVQTYMIVSCWSKDRISPNDLFPGLFDDLPGQKPDWMIFKERLLAHANDYKRIRGDA